MLKKELLEDLDIITKNVKIFNKEIKEEFDKLNFQTKEEVYEYIEKIDDDFNHELATVSIICKNGQIDNVELNFLEKNIVILGDCQSEFYSYKMLSKLNQYILEMTGCVDYYTKDEILEKAFISFNNYYNTLFEYYDYCESIVNKQIKSYSVSSVEVIRSFVPDLQESLLIIKKLRNKNLKNYKKYKNKNIFNIKFKKYILNNYLTYKNKLKEKTIQKLIKINIDAYDQSKVTWI